MRYSRTARLTLLLLATLILLGGCGQKGPLYMPDAHQDEQQEEK
jgi:predicted small lipoprotein YifL